MNSTVSLLSMPLEVLLQITSYLTTRDYGSLRTTCKHTEASLFSSFAKEFFSKRQFTITEFSLNALVDISRSRLAPSMTYLIINLDRPVCHHLTNDLGNNPAQRAIKQNKRHHHYLRHMELLDIGQDVDLLTEAFRNLPNLETVGLRNFDSRGRYRDSSNWNSYGTPTYMAETGQRLEPVYNMHSNGLGESSNYACHVFLTILRALGNARDAQPSPSRLEVILRRCRLPDRAFSIPRQLEEKIFPVLADLKALYVVLDSSATSVMVTDGTATGSISFSVFIFCNFLLRTQSLEHLRINCDGLSVDSVRALLTWLSHNSHSATTTLVMNMLASDNELPTIPSFPKLSNLTHLEIGMATVDLQVLLKLYSEYKPTLRSISLHKVVLIDSETQHEGRVDLWTRLCKQIARLGLALTNIKFSYVHQQHTPNSSPGFPIDFGGEGDRYVKEWTGSDLGHALKDFIDSIPAPLPDDLDEDEDEDEDEDDEDDEDEDEDEEETESTVDEDEEGDDDDNAEQADIPMTLNQVVAIALGQDQTMDLGN